MRTVTIDGIYIFDRDTAHFQAVVVKCRWLSKSKAEMIIFKPTLFKARVKTCLESAKVTFKPIHTRSALYNPSLSISNLLLCISEYFSLQGTFVVVGKCSHSRVFWAAPHTEL